MTNDEQYVPSEAEMRHAYWLTRMLDHHASVDAAFDRFLARVRRDAARQAEAERDEWRQTALDERAAALDALEQIKARDARAADIWDEGWAQGMAYVTGMERGTDDDHDHATTNPYRASETA